MPVDKKEIERYIARDKELRTNRATWESHWQEVCDYCIPRKATVTVTGMPGEKRMSQIYDSTALRALEVLAAGLNNYLTSTVNKWFELKTENDDLMEIPEVQAWLQHAERRMYSVLNGSNFGNEIHESYLDDGSIGTSIMYAEEDPQDLVRFYTRHIAECVILEDNRGRVDTLFRRFPYTARQAFQDFGNRAGESILKNYTKKPEEPYEIMHVVCPRVERIPRKRDRLNMPFASLYIAVKDKHLISEGGYHEMPYMVSRWLKGSCETYGRSPGMVALPDIKMLNQMSKTTLKGAQKVVDPPLMVPDDGIVGTVRLTPSGINYVRRDAWTNNMKPEPMKLGGDLRLGLEMENQRRESINKSFFVDLFLMLTERPEMTATEVIERVEERMSILGPVLGRLMSEKLDPLVSRIFDIMLRADRFMPPPEALHGQKITIEYVSILARVQKAYEAKAIRRTFSELGPYIELFPTMADNVDPDQLFDVIADIHGFPHRARRPRRKIEEIRQARIEVSEETAAKDDAARLIQAITMLQKAGGNVPAKALPSP